jgi:preprotein translocase subunit SecF
VQAAIAATTRRMPKAMPYPPTYRKVDPSALPIYFVALSSKSLPIYKVDEYARSVLAPQLSILDGVAQVNIFGSAKYAVRIQADPNALAARQMGINELVDAANLLNTNQPTGTLNGSTKTSVIHAEGQLMNAEAFRKQIIGFRNGAPVTFGDVARVIDAYENIRDADWVNDDRAITVSVQRQPGSNTIAVVDAIKKILPQFEKDLPPSIQMTVFYDRSLSIRGSVNDVQKTLLIAGAMVVGVIFIFLRRVSATFIPSVALPLAVIGTFAGMSLLGFSLDNLSLMALTLSVGFVVDDAIVMLENIVRHVEAGEQPYQAALRGSREIGFTILSMTLSLAAVFIPVVFMGSLVGRLLHEFALTIIVAILISGLISITLTPMRPYPEERARQETQYFLPAQRGRVQWHASRLRPQPALEPRSPAIHSFAFFRQYRRKLWPVPRDAAGLSAQRRLRPAARQHANTAGNLIRSVCPLLPPDRADRRTRSECFRRAVGRSRRTEYRVETVLGTQAVGGSGGNRAPGEAAEHPRHRGDNRESADYPRGRAGRTVQLSVHAQRSGPEGAGGNLCSPAARHAAGPDLRRREQRSRFRLPIGAGRNRPPACRITRHHAR